MTTRTYRYRPDGTSYEITRPPRKPAVHFLHTSQAVGPDGKPIKASELRRLNRDGKNIHVGELRNIAMDADREQTRQRGLDKQRRKAQVADAISGRGW